MPRGVQLRRHDVILGCRYPDGKIINWPLKRHVLSFLANALIRLLLSRRIADYTSGFRFYSRTSTSCANRPSHKGYIYLSETLALFLRRGLRIACFPIVFVNRQRGASNMGLGEVKSAPLGILRIAWSYRVSK